jgi:hypothetical protein
VLWIVGWPLTAGLVVVTTWVVTSCRARRRHSQPPEALAWMVAGVDAVLWLSAQIWLASS